VVDLLLRKNVDVDAKDYDGRTPLSYAAYEGATSIAKLLLDKKADVNAKDKSIGATPLQEALSDDPGLINRRQNQKADIVKLLLRNGADPNSTNHEGFTRLHLAASLGRPDIIQELLERGADPSLRSDS
ncbi:ankyrin repeat protein, partial [Phyllosticta citrichinensis]